jgi:hypothetical protein
MPHRERELSGSISRNVRSLSRGFPDRLDPPRHSQPQVFIGIKVRLPAFADISFFGTSHSGTKAHTSQSTDFSAFITNHSNRFYYRPHSRPSFFI